MSRGGGTILAVGCGDGLLLRQFRRLGEAVGRELSAEHLNQARRNLADERFHPTLGSAEDINGGHLRYFTFGSLDLLLSRSGFRAVQRAGYGRFGCLHHFWPTLMSAGVQLVSVEPRLASRDA